MTPFLRLCLLASLLLAALTSAAPAGVRAQEAPKYWIFLDGKPGAETIEISERARHRRLRRGLQHAGHFDRFVSPAYVERLEALGIGIVVESRWLNAVSAHISSDQMDRLRELPFVRDVRDVAVLDRAQTATGTPSTPFSKIVGLDFGPSATQLAVVNAIKPLEAGIDGTGVRLGFLDTAYRDFDHPAFARLIDDGRLIAVRDFVGTSQPSASHGMNVASVAVGFDAGKLIGPAHGAEVLAAITEYVPTETNREEDFFVAGLEWLEAMGADVVNVSLGYTTFDAGERSYTTGDLDGDTGITTIAADRAAALGVVMVASAGNEACSSPQQCWYYVSTPADGDSVIAVGAVMRDSSRVSFSSFGPTADGRLKPDVSAMGSGVYIAVPGGYQFGSGTSFASPLVAGVVCQMLQVNPALMPMEVRDILRTTASQASSPDNALGWGIVNAAAAVDAAARAGMADGDDRSISATPYPVPATEEVFIHINAGVAERVSVEVYDLLGRRVVDDVPGFVTPGGTSIRVPTGQLGSGVYAFVVRTESLTTSGTFVIAR